MRELKLPQVERRTNFARNRIFLFLCALLFTTMQNSLFAQCDLATDDTISISFDNDCEATITPDMALEDASTSCPGGTFLVEVFDDNGLIPTSPIVNSDYLGQMLTVVITDTNSGTMSADVTLTVVDETQPSITCTPDVTISCFGGTITPPTATDNCGSTPTLMQVGDDNVIDGDCNPYIRTIERTYVAVDDEGNESASCTQTIFVEAIVLANVVAPTSTTLSCTDTYTTDTNGNPSPTETGYPTYNGEDLDETFNADCDITVSYSDQLIVNTSCLVRISRTWTIVEFCNSPATDEQYVQLIEISDGDAPIITCADDTTVSTDANACDASVAVPLPTVSQDCQTTFTYDISYNGNTISNYTAGDLITLSPGDNIIDITVNDGCGNSDNCQVTITVADEVPPTPVCSEFITTSLTAGGISNLFVNSFDNGSHDNCGVEQILVKRMDDGAACSVTEDTFSDQVNFCCADVGTDVMVIVRVFDAAGNFNDCMVSVTVNDKSDPQITCPPDITVSCILGADDLSIFGTVVTDAINQTTISIDDPNNPTAPTSWGTDGLATDNCSVVLSGPVVENNLDGCGTGTITRTWLATDAGGLTASCTQTITVEQFVTFDEDRISWPEDVTVQCGDDMSTAVTGLPIIDDSDICAMVFLSVPDDNLLDAVSSSNGICQVLQRTFTVNDMCQGDTPAGVSFTYTQKISIQDLTAPVFSSTPADVTVDLGTNCEGTLVVPVLTASDGSCSSGVDIVVSSTPDVVSDTGTFTNITGSHNDVITITYTATDACGNSSTTSFNATLQDTEAPMAICIQGLATTVMSDGMITIPATFFESSNSMSSDNCTDYNDLEFYIQATVENAPVGTTTPTTTEVTFDCTDLGDQWVEIWVVDEAGNTDVCQTFVDIQDNNDICSSFPCPDVPVVTNVIQSTGASAGCGLTGSTAEIVLDGGNEETFLYTWVPNVGTFNPATPHIRDELPQGQLTVTIALASDPGCTRTVSFFHECFENLIADVGGHIRDQAGEDVENVEVKLGGGMNESAWTDADGSFMFSDVPTLSNYTITPEKNGNPLNGVTTYDIVILQKHILGVETLDSPYKILAADVNRSLAVTAADIIDLRKIILHIHQEFPSNTSWRFIDADFEFLDEVNPFATTFPEVLSINELTTPEMYSNFIAVKIGDLDNSAIPNSLLGAEDRTTTGTLSFGVEDEKLEVGKTHTIDFRAKDFKAIEGFQFTLDFDEKALAFVGFNEGALVGMNSANLGLMNLEEGIINASWNATTAESNAIKDDVVLFSLTFNANQATTVGEVLAINSRSITAEAYTATDEGLEKFDLALALTNKERTTIVGGSFELYQNIPNPFNEETTISFNLPKASKASLTIYDLSGKAVQRFERDFSKGYNEVPVDKMDLTGAGIFYYQLETAEFTQTKKMILF